MLAPIQPSLTGNGLAMRVASFVDAASTTHDVRVVVFPMAGWLPRCPHEPQVPVGYVALDPPRHRLELAAVLGDRRWRDLLAAAQPLPAGVPPLSLALAGDVVRAAGVGSGTPVHVVRSYLGPLGLVVAARLSSPWATLDLDDDDEALAAAAGDQGGAGAYHRLVGTCAPRFSAVCLASAPAAAALAERQGLGAMVVVNSVAVPAGLPPRLSGSHRILFLGNLTYPPNIEAATLLVEEVLPAVQGLVAEPVTVVLAGDHANGPVSALSRAPGVTVTGFVDDPADLYAGSAVVVAPIQRGSGTRIKLLEAFAYGVPVVTTPAGADGLEVADGRELLLGSDGAELARVAASVLEDGDLAERVRLAAFWYVRTHHSRAAVGAQVQSLLAAAAQAGMTGGVIPNVVHFVHGLTDDAPFSFMSYVAVESARRVLEPDAMLIHHKHRPRGPWWERVQRHVRLVEVELSPEVLAADYSAGMVPDSYRYAHHADFARLDALIEHGGIYADLDTVFVRRPDPVLFEAPFVIGAEQPTRHELTGETRPSLCNALMMSEPGAEFARAWRREMPASLDGTWSNHSGTLAWRLSERMPGSVRVEPEETFFPFGPDPVGLADLFLGSQPIPDATVSVHLWAHLWWEAARRDSSPAHAGWFTPSGLRRARTTIGRLAAPYVPPEPASQSWAYLSFDESSGYGVAADRYRSALEESGQPVDWVPWLPGLPGPRPYAPPRLLDPLDHTDDRSDGQPSRARPAVVVAHLVPEYLPAVRRACPDALLVGYTAWETDRIPRGWPICLAAADLVMVPSRFSARAVEAGGAAVPVAVVPHAVAGGSPEPSTGWPHFPADRFVFYTIGDWTERKTVAKTIEAYLSAFTAADPVVLVVKTSPIDVARKAPSALSLARLLAGRRSPPDVVLVTKELSAGQVAALHDRGDCFVSLTRGEGWGLGAFDAAASGNPVVMTGFGGQLDYLGSSPYLVDFGLVAVDDPAGGDSYTPDQQWAEADIDHAVALLRLIVADPGPAWAHADLLAQEIGQRFRPAAVAALFRDAVGRCGGGR